MEIKTILEEVVTTLVIEKSKFISYLIPVESKNEANEALEKLRKKHFDATHVCYAYIINDEVTLYKSSDDGEPSQTAGAPILNVLRKNDLSNVVCAVVRYFGGIKLGAGGLVRAYSGSASDVINCADIVEYATVYKYEARLPIANAKTYQQAIERQGAKIISVSYGVDVVLKFYSFNEIQDDYATLISCDLEVKK